MLVKDLKNEINLKCEYSRNICNYSGQHYLCDIVSEIADGNTSLYYSDIINYISNNVEQVNETIEEFGWDGCGADLYKAGQMAEFCEIERKIYDELDEAMLNFCYDYILYDLKIKEITEEENEKINELCNNVDNNETLDTFEDFLTELFEKEDL